MENKALEKQLKKEAKAVGLTYEEYTDILIAEVEAKQAPTIGDMLQTISHLNFQFC